MPGLGGPPLHKDAITAATERADTFTTTQKLDAEPTERIAENAIDAGKISRFPVYALEPYQYQRAASLEKAFEILSDNYGIEDIVMAAAFIESGKLPDA